MIKTYSMDLGGREFSVESGRMAGQASGAVLVKYGDTSVLVTATASDKPREGIDFFPLSIDYEERLYSVGKIPGGFIKREGRPTENATLTSRLIDRPLRPLFPEGYRNDVSVVATVLGVDQDCSPEIAAMIGSSIALSISDIPFLGPIGSVNVGLIDGEYIINPNAEQRELTDLDLTVSSTHNKVMMIEAGANEVSNEEMLNGIIFANNANKKIVEFTNKIVEEIGKEKHGYEDHSVSEELIDKVRNLVDESRMDDAVIADDKEHRAEKRAVIADEVNEILLKDFTGDTIEEGEYLREINNAINVLEELTVRKLILKEHKRPDSREIKEIRKLSSEIDIVPRVHGSSLFSRGQTQVLAIATLGSMGEVQRLDGLDESEEIKRYMHHYNFPSFSVGETRPSRGPGRREIGHGALAEKALVPVLPSEEDFPYAIRVVSEVISSNGSTSQASVCASSLALMAAGVPVSKAVAGISVGLVTNENDDDDFILITDIQGLEDFYGDMDFKVAGTKDGITAIQLDMKIHGITEEIIRKSLEETEEARMKILDESMNPCIDKAREELSEYAPKIASLQIDVEKIAEVIGSRGKTIKAIIEESGVDKIDTEDDGRVFVASSNMDSVNKAVELIKLIAEDPEPGRIYDATVMRVMEYGAFVAIAPEKEGLVHISQLGSKRVNKVEDIVKEGDKIRVKLLEIDGQGRLNFSRKEALEENN